MSNASKAVCLVCSPLEGRGYVDTLIKFAGSLKKDESIPQSTVFLSQDDARQHMRQGRPTHFSCFFWSRECTTLGAEICAEAFRGVPVLVLLRDERRNVIDRVVQAVSGQPDIQERISVMTSLDDFDQKCLDAVLAYRRTVLEQSQALLFANDPASTHATFAP